MSGTSVTVGPRVEYDTAGYVRLRVWDSDRQRDCYLYLHRLTAYAHGELDDLWSDDHVHHNNADPWCNDPANLQAVDPDTHAEYEPHVANIID